MNNQNNNLSRICVHPAITNFSFENDLNYDSSSAHGLPNTTRKCEFLPKIDIQETFQQQIPWQHQQQYTEEGDNLQRELYLKDITITDGPLMKSEIVNNNFNQRQSHEKVNSKITNNQTNTITFQHYDSQTNQQQYQNSPLKRTGPPNSQSVMLKLNKQGTISRQQTIIDLTKVPEKLAAYLRKVVNRFKEQSVQLQSKIFNKQSNNRQLQLINDLSIISNFQYDDEYIEVSQNQHKFFKRLSVHINKLKKLHQSEFTQKLCLRAKKLVHRFPVIHPSSRSLIFWDIFHSVCIIFSLYYILLDSVINIYFSQLYGFLWRSFILTTFIVFICDIFINFFKGFYRKGETIMERHQIFKYYITSKDFVIDLVALVLIFLSLVSFEGWNKVGNFLIIFKMNTILKIFNKYQEYFSVKSVNTLSVLKVVELAIIIIFIAHLFACLFLGLAFQLEQSQSQTWLTAKNINYEDWLTQYAYSFYWAVTTMITVGYGDIIPTNTYEVCFVTLTMFVSCGVFAFSFNLIGSIINDLGKEDKEFNKEMRLVNNYLERNNINKLLQVQIRKYLEYQHKSSAKYSHKEEKDILSKLNQDLRDRLNYEKGMQALEKCLQTCPYFQSNFSLKLLQNLHQIIKEIHTEKGEVRELFRENQLEDDACIYIVYEGRVDIYLQGVNLNNNDLKQKEKLLQIKEQGEYFGELAFFSGLPQNYSARTKGPTSLFYIQREQFINFLQNYTEDYQRFCYIKDQLCLSQDLTLLNIKCSICNRAGHNHNTCNLVHYAPNTQNTLLKVKFQDFYNESMERQQQFKRKSHQKWDLIAQLNQAEKITQSKIDYSAQLLQKQKGCSAFILLDQASLDIKSIQKIGSFSSPDKSSNQRRESIREIFQYQPFAAGNDNTNQDNATLQSPQQQQSLTDFSEQINCKPLNVSLDDFDQLGYFTQYYPVFNFNNVLQKLILIRNRKMSLLSEILQQKKQRKHLYSFNFRDQQLVLNYQKMLILKQSQKVQIDQKYQKKVKFFLSN